MNEADDEDDDLPDAFEAPDPRQPRELPRYEAQLAAEASAQAGCVRCGNSCRSIYIWQGDVSDFHQRDTKRWIELHDIETFVAHREGTDYWGLKLPIPCSQLVETEPGRYGCAIYDRRPLLCRTYEGENPDGPQPGCGFYRDVDWQPPAATITGPAPGEGSEIEPILRALPGWFGIEEALLDYVAAVGELDTWTATRAGETLGFLSAKRHSEQAAEIHVMAIRPEARRQGLGRRLLRAAENSLRARGVRFLQVKTLSASRPDEGYAETRAFYEAQGFVPLEELPTLWGEANPCQLYVKHLP